MLQMKSDKLVVSVLSYSQLDKLNLYLPCKYGFVQDYWQFAPEYALILILGHNLYLPV